MWDLQQVRVDLNISAQSANIAPEGIYFQGIWDINCQFTLRDQGSLRKNDNVFWGSWEKVSGNRSFFKWINIKKSLGIKGTWTPLGGAPLYLIKGGSLNLPLFTRHFPLTLCFHVLNPLPGLWERAHGVKVVYSTSKQDHSKPQVLIHLAFLHMK